MALVINDRVQETTTSTGTGTVNLGGAVSGFEGFVSAIGTGNTTYYCIQGEAQFEVGIGTVTDGTPDTLSRDTVISSSNADALVDFPAGTKNVFCTTPASKTVYKDANNDIQLADGEHISFDNGQLEISTDGLNSFIENKTDNDLYIKSVKSVYIQTFNSELSAAFIRDDGVQLYHDNNKKIETTSGGVTVTGTVTETSSIDYKENIKPLEFNEAIYSVEAVKYDRKDGSQKDEVGVIAEELYKVLPDLVELKDGKPDSVKYTKLTMYLLEALKKQNKEIQELKSQKNEV